MNAGTPIMTPVRLVCPFCGKSHQRHGAWTKGDFCSRECYLAQPFPLSHPTLTLSEVRKVAARAPNQKLAAAAIGISYPQFRRVMKKLDLRGCFPANGCASIYSI